MLATLLYVLVGGFIAILGVIMGAVLILTAVRQPQEKKTKDVPATTEEIEQLVGPGQYKEVTESKSMFGRRKEEEPYVPYPSRTGSGLTFAEAKAQEATTRPQPTRAVAYPPAEKRGQ